MNILVDTSIWSMALRRSGTLTEEDQFLVLELSELINEVRVVMIGPVRQELLSGISSHEQYSHLKKKLHAFEDLPLTREYYERAAEFYNMCRKNGVQGSQIDFLICATAAIAKKYKSLLRIKISLSTQSMYRLPCTSQQGKRICKVRRPLK